jgi:anti-anti-sigma factor
METMKIVAPEKAYRRSAAHGPMPQTDPYCGSTRIAVPLKRGDQDCRCDSDEYTGGRTACEVAANDLPDRRYRSIVSLRRASCGVSLLWHRHLTSELLSSQEVTMSLTVAFPDFAANREHRGAHSFVCTLYDSDAGPTWVHVAGALGASSAARLAQALRQTRRPPRLVVLDLRELTSIDASGVDVIVDASARAQRAGCQLTLIRGPSEVDRMFTASRGAELMKIIDLDPFEPRTMALLRFSAPDDAA